MPQRALGLTLIVLVLALLLAPTAAFASPVAGVLSGLLHSVWTKILLVFLTFFFLPVLLYVSVQETQAEKATLADLRQLESVHFDYAWTTLEERIKASFLEVHAAWSRERMRDAAAFMTSWLWQNQQLAHLDRFRELGLINHCTVKQIDRIRPLFVSCPSETGEIEGSRLVVSVIATMEDYLAERVSGHIVEGRRGYQEIEAVWTFLYEAGRWVVSAIEEGAMSLTYARLVNEVPRLFLTAADRPKLPVKAD